MSSIEQQVRAISHVRRFTVLALATGAVPVPGASAAIVAENAALVNVVASEFGVDVSIGTVVAALGPAAAANAIGRTVFVEGARLLGWAGGPFGIAAVSALGAATAGLQTWVIGHLAVAMCQNGGIPLAVGEARRVIAEARAGFGAFRKDADVANEVARRRSKAN
jgi:hypothetical protein